jgi:hypothetical protein
LMLRRPNSATTGKMARALLPECRFRLPDRQSQRASGQSRRWQTSVCGRRHAYRAGVVMCIMARL